MFLWLWVSKDSEEARQAEPGRLRTPQDCVRQWPLVAVQRTAPPQNTRKTSGYSCEGLPMPGETGDRDPYNRVRDRGLERTQESRSEVTQGL